MAEFHPLVEELGLGALHRALDALPKTVTLPAQASDRARQAVSDTQARAMHEALLRLQRQSGSLGLNK